MLVTIQPIGNLLLTSQNIILLSYVFVWMGGLYPPANQLVDVPACHVWLSEGINQYSVDIPYDSRSRPSNPGSHPISVYFNDLQSAFFLFQNHPKLITSHLYHVISIYIYLYRIYIRYLIFIP